MLQRLGLAAALLVVSQSSVVAQTMRFTTNVGSFDMEFNPTNDPNLQPLVDNIVAYIGLGRYHFSAINRAADGEPGASDDFVLQMGGFLGFLPTTDLWPGMHTSVEALKPVVVDANGDGQVDFDAQSNTRGTVSLALQAGNPNSGTSSFFVNLGSNTFLDGQGFVPFARISDMSTVDRIMQLTQADLSSAVGQPGNLAFVDVPLAEDGQIVVVSDVKVVQAADDFSFVGPIASALELASRNSIGSAPPVASGLEQSSAALIATDPLLVDGQSPPVAAPPTSSVVPEPATVALGLLGIFATFMAGRRPKR
jgi:cyclophilin family peptidyl-prolyl cis-trans isomerase